MVAKSNCFYCGNGFIPTGPQNTVCPECHDKNEASKMTDPGNNEVSAPLEVDLLSKRLEPDNRERAEKYGYISMVLSAFGFSIYWYSNNGGGGDGLYYCGACLFVLVALPLLLFGFIYSISGLAIYGHSKPCWIALIINVLPFVKRFIFLFHRPT